MDDPFRQTRLACPNCSTPLVEVERAEVMIDACPGCRGVWLDRGELDKLLDRERRSLSGVDDEARDFVKEMRGERSVPPRAMHRHADPDHHYDAGASPRPKRKKRGLLSEMFDELFD